MLQSKVISLLNEALNQIPHFRKEGVQALYFCKCGHYKRKLEVNLEKFIFHCWVCNERGTLGKLLKLFNASHELRSRLFELSKDIRQIRYVNQKELITSKELTLPYDFRPLSTTIDSPEYKNAMYYLKRRNVIKEDIIRYNIGYCESGEYESHIIIPSYNSNGNLNFFIGRRYYDIDGEISHKKPETSMNIIGFECFINFNEPLTLVEGCFDALAIRNNAIPLFGKYLQPKLLSAIELNKVKRVNMILDNDAIKDAVSNYQRIKRVNGNIDIHVIKLDGKDASVIGYERMHDIIRNSKPFEFRDLIAHKVGL